MQAHQIPKVELRFSCTKLSNLDVLSKSDPQVFVYLKRANGEFELRGATEKIQNNLNPIFKKPVDVEYRFEELQSLKFIVLDIDDGSNTFDITKQDIIGSAETSLGSVLSKPGSTLVKDLLNKHGKFSGTITVTAEEIKATGHNLKFRLGGKKFDKKDLFGKSDPYFILSKQSAAGFQAVHQSEVHKNTLDPEFQEVDLKLENVCGGDIKRPIKFEFFDYDSVGKHDIIGEFVTTVEELTALRRADFDVINIKKQEKKKDYKNSGTVHFYNAAIYKDATFLDYIVGGCEISLIIGIDCTGSNGNPASPHSLHYKHPTEPNEYAKAIVSVGNVLAPYDFDGFIPTYGFGGVVPGLGLSHCFPMGLIADKLNCFGVPGVLDTYYNNITRVDFSGPTYFAPLIRNAAQFASQGQSQINQKYTILMIITDGEICDMDNTIDEIIRASVLPLSIVIVGVGHADFSNMDTLDGDNGVLASKAGRAERDIVQFVPFSKFAGKDFNLLAAETLREIPSQFMSFMKKVNFHPNPPRQFVPQPSVIPIQQVQPVQPVQPMPSQQTIVSPPPPVESTTATTTSTPIKETP